MKLFKSREHAQRLLEVQGIIAEHFRPKRHQLKAARYRTLHRYPPAVELMTIDPN